MNSIFFYISNYTIWTLTGIVMGLFSSIIYPGQVKGGTTASVVVAIFGSVSMALLVFIVFHLDPIRMPTEAAFSALLGATFFALVHRFVFREKQLLHKRITSFR